MKLTGDSADGQRREGEGGGGIAVAVSASQTKNRSAVATCGRRERVECPADHPGQASSKIDPRTTNRYCVSRHAAVIYVAAAVSDRERAHSCHESTKLTRYNSNLLRSSMQKVINERTKIFVFSSCCGYRGRSCLDPIGATGPYRQNQIAHLVGCVGGALRTTSGLHPSSSILQ